MNMNYKKEPRYEREPENPPGDFYVAKDQCIICCVPLEQAPDLMGFYADVEGQHRESHCYFKKQPGTQAEIQKAIDAVNSCCCGTLRYCGTDPNIIKALGNSLDTCDFPIKVE